MIINEREWLMRRLLLIAILTLIFSVSSSAAFAGTIVGKVVVQGDIALEPKEALSKEALTRFKNSLVVSEKAGLANVVVYVDENFKGDFHAEGVSPVIDQREETYRPHVTAILKGTEVKFLNSDKVLHNVHTHLNGESLFNVAMPVFKKQMTKSFNTPGKVEVTCDVHPHMQAFVYILENPYFAVSNEGGLFVIKDVPEGAYKIKLWHERLGQELSKTVQVKADGKSPVVFEVSADSLQ